jgi:molybdate transport system regulatory protein
MISARNRIKGVVKKVEKGTVAAVVKVEIEPAVVTAMITKEAVDELDIEEGDEVQVVIKATEVMVLKGSD